MQRKESAQTTAKNSFATGLLTESRRDSWHATRFR